MRYIKEIVVIMVAMLTFAVSVFALPGIPSQYGTTDAGAWAAATASAIASQDVQGGNYTNMNFSSVTVTDNWAVIYGTLDLLWSFEDSSQNRAYIFQNTTAPTGYVFFAPSTNVGWTALTGGTGVTAHLTGEDTTLGLDSTVVDSVYSTYMNATGAVHPDLNYTGINITKDTSFDLETNNAAGVSIWDQALFWDGEGDIAYCAWVNQSQTSFNNHDADYQIMLPTADGDQRTYYVYLALE